MATLRCPYHDVTFESDTDHKFPGVGDNHPKYAGGVSGHPDCPLCKKEGKTATKPVTK